MPETCISVLSYCPSSQVLGYLFTEQSEIKTFLHSFLLTPFKNLEGYCTQTREDKNFWKTYYKKQHQAFKDKCI